MPAKNQKEWGPLSFVPAWGSCPLGPTNHSRPELVNKEWELIFIPVLRNGWRKDKKEWGNDRKKQWTPGLLITLEIPANNK